MTCRLWKGGACALLLLGAGASGSSAEGLPNGLPRDTQALIQHLPDDTGAVVVIDSGDDNPSIQAVRAEQDRMKPAAREVADSIRADLSEGWSRILRLFGLTSDDLQLISGSLGSRFVFAAVPPARKNGPPNVIALASIKDRAHAEQALSALVRTLARNAEESVRPLLSGQLHLWDGLPLPKSIKLSYFVGDDVVAAATDPALLQDVAAPQHDAIWAWVSRLAGASPRGLMNAYLSPNLIDLVSGGQGPKAGDLGFAGGTTALTLSADGLMFTETALTGKEGMLPTMLANAGHLPALDDSSFDRIPADSLAAVAVSAPSEWLKTFGGAGLLGPFMTGGGGPAQMIQMLTTLFSGPTTVALRSALPLPSALVTVGGADADAARQKLEVLRGAATQMKVPVSEIALASGDRATAFKIGQPPFENLMVSQVGRYAVAATDRRTLEEVSSIERLGGPSLASTAQFQAVRRQVGDGAQIMAYADFSPLSGAGMMAADLFTQGSAMGMQLAQAISRLRGIGVGIAVGADRLTSRTFISGSPSGLPALAGMVVPIAAGVLVPLMARATQRATIMHPPAPPRPAPPVAPKRPAPPRTHVAPHRPSKPSKKAAPHHG